MALKKYKLGEIAEILISSIDKKSKEGESPVRLCNFVDVYHNWAITADMVSNFMESTTSEKNIDRFSLKKGYVAFTKDSETRDDIGIPTYIAEDLDNTVLGYHCALVKPDENIISGKYLNAFLHSDYIKRYFELNATGSGMRYTLSVDTLYNIPILAPSLDIQKRIGDLFSNIDRKICINRSLNHYLEAMAKQLYDYWFVQFDFLDANGNPYKSSGGKMVWNEKLKREIPEGWKDVCFKDICNVKRGASPRPIDEYMDQSHNGISWVKISDATSSESPFLTLVKEHIIPEGGRHSVHVSPNTLIVSNSASPGIPKFIEIDACVHDGWLILTGYKEYYRYYFYYIIHMIRHNLLHMASGSIFKNLKTDYLKEYVCLNPPQKVLQDYDKIVHPLMSSLLGKQLEIEELTKERDRLLALFMTGQVSVKQLNNDLSHD